MIVAAAMAAELPAVDPVALEQATRRVERRAMGVLGTWSAVNLVGGTVGYFTTENPELQGFHAMNAAWNTVNAGLAIGGLLGGRNRDVSSLAAVQKRRRNLQRALRINIALDGVYVASGITSVIVGTELDRPQITGAGLALIVQGGFLTVFDLTFLDAHVRAGNTTLGVQLTADGGRLVGTW